MMTIGNVSKISADSVEWQIRDFLSLPAKANKVYYSPDFFFADTTWFLIIYPNGEKESPGRDRTVGFIDLYLSRDTSGFPICLEFSLGLKTGHDSIVLEKHFTQAFEKREGRGCQRILSRSELFQRKSELLPCNVLTLICKLKYSTTDITSLSESVKAQCSFCKVILEANEDISFHERKCMYKPIKCPECGDVSQLKNWYDHKCQIAGTEASEKLLNDFKKMMQSGDHSDTIIKVKGEDFRLHKTILAARNSYFDSMFKSDMKEKTTGIVTIDDCEPDVFRSFIHFIYTGKVDKLSVEKICDLYEVADKYQEDQLKEQCLCLMMDLMSVDNLCDVIVSALRLDETKLLQKATELFCSKTQEIVRTVKWQKFLVEYPTQANELYIKALDRALNK